MLLEITDRSGMGYSDFYWDREERRGRSCKGKAAVSREGGVWAFCGLHVVSHVCLRSGRDSRGTCVTRCGPEQACPFLAAAAIPAFCSQSPRSPSDLKVFAGLFIYVSII